MDKKTMMIVGFAAAAAIVVGVLLYKKYQSQEKFGWGGWGGGRGYSRPFARPWGGYRSRPYQYHTFGFPYSNYFTTWPPNLYGVDYTNYVYTPQCVDVNAADDCEPNRPIKIGKDLNNDGIKESWKCCRKWM